MTDPGGLGWPKEYRTNDPDDDRPILRIDPIWVGDDSPYSEADVETLSSYDNLVVTDEVIADMSMDGQGYTLVGTDGEFYGIDGYCTVPTVRAWVVGMTETEIAELSEELGTTPDWVRWLAIACEDYCSVPTRPTAAEIEAWAEDWGDDPGNSKPGLSPSNLPSDPDIHPRPDPQGPSIA